MTEAQNNDPCRQEFARWAKSHYHVLTVTVANRMFAAWKHQQKRIDELEAKVNELSNVDFPVIGKMQNRIDELESLIKQ